MSEVTEYVEVLRAQPQRTTNPNFQLYLSIFVEIHFFDIFQHGLGKYVFH